MRSFWVAACLCAGSMTVQAEPIVWHLQDVIFSDSTTVTGSFVFDASSNSYTSFNITTSGGSSVPAESSWVLDPYSFWTASGNQGFVAVDSANPDLTGAHVISLFSELDAMTNAGGVVNLDFGVSGTCSDSECMSHRTDLANSNALSSGLLVDDPPAVPEPSALVLLGSVLLASAAAGRRFSKRQSR